MNIAWDSSRLFDEFMFQGETPINVNWRYKWLWLYALYIPKLEKVIVWILPVNTELFNKVLADFAREFSLGADKRILWLWINRLAYQ